MQVRTLRYTTLINLTSNGYLVSTRTEPLEALSLLNTFQHGADEFRCVYDLHLVQEDKFQLSYRQSQETF
jgi:hypothetical protein